MKIIVKFSSLIIVVTIVIIAVIRQIDGKEQSQTSSTYPLTPVSVVKVFPEKFSRIISGIGTLEAVNQVNITAEVSGRITGIKFQSGDFVKKETLLVSMDDEEDKALLNQLKVKTKFFRKELDRVKKLKDMAISDSRVDEAQTQYDDLLSQITRVQSAINKKGVRAPFSGVVGVVKVNLGQYLQPGDIIASLTDMSYFNVNFELPEKYLDHIHQGQKVAVHIDAIDKNLFTASINTIEPQINKQTHSITVQSRLHNDSGSLRPGLFAEVDVHLESNIDYLMVPETAIERTTYGDTLYIVKKNNDENLSVHRIQVKLGERNTGKIIVLKGLKAGSQVVVSGQNRLFDGAPVRIKAPETTIDMSVSTVTD